jgi:protein-S-isoprenylcysteine O-methyltransferase Ste14
MAAAPLSFIDDPLAGWANDDLLLSQDTRDEYAARHPAAFAIFDWPELRARFVQFDGIANAARRASRRGGGWATSIGLAALIVAALTPVAQFHWPGRNLAVYLGVAAAVLTLVASLWGWAQLLTGRRKGEWLINRYRTERLRQLHFQFTLAHLPLAAAATRDADSCAEWQRQRALALAAFDAEQVRNVTAAYQRTIEDIAEDAFWVDPSWAERGPLPDASPELDTLFAVLANQRFGIQERFSGFKLRHGWHSPATRARAVRTTSDALTLIVLIATLIGAVALIVAGNDKAVAVIWATATVALASAIVLVLRIFNEGLQLTSEAERYRWYRAAVTALAQRFAGASIAGRIELLRDMERLSYQEMRWFLESYENARFVI